MQAIPALLASLGTAGAGVAAGAGAATAGAAAGSLGALSTGLSIAGGVATAVGAISRSAYQASVARNNAIIADQNAEKAALDTQRENQQRGLAAAFEMGDLLAAQSASGLNLGSGSYRLARKSQAELAAKDSSLIAEAGAADVRNFRDDAATFRSESSQSKRAGAFSAISGGLDVATSLVSGAAKVQRQKARKYA